MLHKVLKNTFYFGTMKYSRGDLHVYSNFLGIVVRNCALPAHELLQYTLVQGHKNKNGSLFMLWILGPKKEEQKQWKYGKFAI